MDGADPANNTEISSLKRGNFKQILSHLPEKSLFSFKLEIVFKSFDKQTGCCYGKTKCVGLLKQ